MIVNCLRFPALLVLFIVQAAAAADRPNVLLIVTDNQSEKVIGAYGKDDVRTPNIDALAAEGMLFTRAFAASGVCSPTRATLMTGLMPSQHGVHNALPTEFGIDGWAAVEDLRTLPQTLADAGYATGLVGKYHLGEPYRPQMGFEYWVTFPSGHTTAFYDVDVIDNGRTYNTGDEHLTDFWTRRAVDFLEAQSTDQPFFLYVSYNGPYNLPPQVIEEPRNRHAAYYTEHVPAFPQEPVHPALRRLAIEYSNVEELVAEKGQWWYTEANDPDAATAAAENSWPWQTVVALNNKTAMINLASETQMIDDGVGRLLEVLEARGMADDTIVVYTSDQSSAFGQHGLWGNSSYAQPHPAFMENMRVPLILRQPGVVESGERSGHIVNQVDLFPTLLDLAGMGDIEIANTPGVSIAPTLRGEVQAQPVGGFHEYITVRAIATERWKYVKRLFGDPPELYDLAADPGEYENLAADPAHAEVLAELDGKLDAFFDRYANPKYDAWHGGTAKSVLMYNDKNEQFEATFPNFKPPAVERLPRFSGR